jgi:uncharacterized protein with HEPN domain
MNRDLTYIEQIIQAISKVENYTFEGKEYFISSSLVQDAVIRNIEIIGEIAKRVSPDFKATHYDIPWRKMAGIRDVLIHDYDSIDLDIVWNVVESELPKIKLFLNEL